MKKITALAAVALLALAGCGAPVPATTSTTTVTAQPAPSTPSPLPDSEPAMPIGLEYMESMSDFQGLYEDLDVATGELDFEGTHDIFEAIAAEAEEGLALEDTGNAEFDAEWEAMMTDTLLAAEIGAEAVTNYDVAGLEKSLAYMEKSLEHAKNITEILEEANV